MGRVHWQGSTGHIVWPCLSSMYWPPHRPEVHHLVVRLMGCAGQRQGIERLEELAWARSVLVVIIGVGVLVQGLALPDGQIIGHAPAPMKAQLRADLVAIQIDAETDGLV